MAFHSLSSWSSSRMAIRDVELWKCENCAASSGARRLRRQTLSDVSMGKRQNDVIFVSTQGNDSSTLFVVVEARHTIFLPSPFSIWIMIECSCAFLYHENYIHLYRGIQKKLVKFHVSITSIFYEIGDEKFRTEHEINKQE